LSGVGCPALGELPVMPTTGAIATAPEAYASPFSHAEEQASPGDYRVRLGRSGVLAELTATDRTGWQRFTYPAGAARGNVLFDAGRANQRVFAAQIRVVGDRRLEGAIEAGGFCGTSERHTVYFAARFDRPFAAFGTWRGAAATPGVRAAAGDGP